MFSHISSCLNLLMPTVVCVTAGKPMKQSGNWCSPLMYWVVMSYSWRINAQRANLEECFTNEFSHWRDLWLLRTVVGMSYIWWWNLFKAKIIASNSSSITGYLVARGNSFREAYAITWQGEFSSSPRCISIAEAMVLELSAIMINSLHMPGACKSVLRSNSKPFPVCQTHPVVQFSKPVYWVFFSRVVRTEGTLLSHNVEWNFGNNLWILAATLTVF